MKRRRPPTSTSVLRGPLGPLEGEAGSDDEVVERGPGGGSLGEGAVLVRLAEGVTQRADVVLEARTAVARGGVSFSASPLLVDQVLEVWNLRLLRQQCGDVRLDSAGPHEVDAGLEDPEGVKEPLEPDGLLEQGPLGVGEAEVVVDVVAGDAAGGDRFELVVEFAAGDDERRVELLEDVAVAFELRRSCSSFLNWDRT